MKRLLLALLLLPFLSAAQRDKKDFPDPFEFQLVNSAEGTKAELYTRAATWVAKTYRSSNSVTQLADKDAGRILVKGYTGLRVHGNAAANCQSKIWHVLTIDVKDGKYRAVINDFRHEGCRVIGTTGAHLLDGGDLNRKEAVNKGSFLSGFSPRMWEEVKEMAKEDAEEIRNSLSKAMAVKSITEKDW